MAGRVTWHRLAEEDLTEAYLYYGADSPETAERLVDAVEAALRFLVENPGAGRLRDLHSPRAQGVRSWAVNGFRSYAIFYRPQGDDIAVVRLLHGARDLPQLLEEGP